MEKYFNDRTRKYFICFVPTILIGIILMCIPHIPYQQYILDGLAVLSLVAYCLWVQAEKKKGRQESIEK